MEDTNHHLPEFLSSQKMEHSEMQKHAIELGKAIVQELGLENSTDTLSRWMAHYISEQISIAENKRGKAKIEAEKNCFDTILKLWQFRACYPDDKRPFESFEPIFQTLEKLDPDKPRPFYFRNENKDTEKIDIELKKWLDTALNLDQTFRIFVEYALHNAAKSISEKKYLPWLKKAACFREDRDDINVILNLTSHEKDNSGIIEKINARINILDKFAMNAKK